MCSHPEASFLLSSLLFKPPGSITNWMLLLRLPVCSWLFINSLASINIFLIFAFFSQVIILCSSILTTKGSTDDNAVMSSCVEKLRTVSGGLCCRCWERFEISEVMQLTSVWAAVAVWHSETLRLLLWALCCLIHDIVVSEVEIGPDHSRSLIQSLLGLYQQHSALCLH